MPVSLFLSQYKQMLFGGSRRLREGQVNSQGSKGKTGETGHLHEKYSFIKTTGGLRFVSKAARRTVEVRR